MIDKLFTRLTRLVFDHGKYTKTTDTLKVQLHLKVDHKVIHRSPSCIRRMSNVPISSAVDALKVWHIAWNETGYIFIGTIPVPKSEVRRFYLHSAYRPP